MNHRATNILKVYWQADAKQLADGLEWYQFAHDEARRISEETNLTVAQVAAIIAAVSPGLRWERNIECAERVIRGESLDGLGVRWYDGVRKAKKILGGSNPSLILGGPKTRAFAWIIGKAAGHEMSVCIDGHAYSIWAGQRIKLEDVPSFNERLYSKISGDYIAAARHVGIQGYQLQAITWVVWRHLHNV